MKKLNKKQLILSAVALVLVLMTTIGVTYSWIDDVKLVEFNNDNLAKNNAPLKAGVDINSTVSITKENSVINLGNMLTENNLTETYNVTDESGNTVQRKRAKSNLTPEQISEINKNKGYFYESGGMHLSPCYSDGEYFFFPTNGGTFREGNKDDENVNYISFTVKVTSPDANVDFWFEDSPTISYRDANDQPIPIRQARYAISVNGRSHVYSSEGTANTVVGSAVSPVPGVRSTYTYTYGNDANVSERGKNGNTLFSVKRGNTAYMTVKIWLENDSASSASFSNISQCDIDFRIVSSWAYKRDITIIDQTSSCKFIAANSNTNSSWLGNEPLFFTMPNVLNQMGEKLCEDGVWKNFSIRDWVNISNENGYADAPFHNLKVSDSFVETGTTSEGYSYFKVKNIPLVYNNEQVMLFRAQNYWNTGNYTTSSEYYGIKCYNWWVTNLPDTFVDATYRLYGGSHDHWAYRYFKEDVDSKHETYQGYGTWGTLVKIQVDGRTKAIATTNDNEGVKQEYPSSSLGLARKERNDDRRDLYICDYSDQKTSGEVYIHGMSYEESNECWFAYVPESSTLLQFYYHSDNNTEQGWWAYNSWGGDNPQRRPTDSYKYYLTYHMKHSDKYDGIGYWEGQDKVYLFKNGNIATADKVRARRFKYVGDDEYVADGHSVEDVEMTDTQQKDPRNAATPIFEISTVYNNNPGFYQYVKFSGFWNDNPDGTRYSRRLPMCPGCYFDWQGNRWLGSLSDSGRNYVPTEDNGGEDTGDDNPGTTTEILTSAPTEDGVYLVGKLSGGASETEYAKFDTSSSGGKLALRFKSGLNYYIRVYRKQGSNITNYGNKNYNAQSPFSIGSSVSPWTLSISHSDKVAFFPNANGYFVAEISSIDNNDAKINWEYKSTLD